MIGESEWQTIQAALAPVSASHLRHLVRDCGLPLAPTVEGVRQETFDALERSLVALAGEYEAGGRARRQAIRDIVIEGKDHARLSARKAEHRETKQEMILWMLTWLENPPLFSQWVRLRREASHT